MSDSENDTSSSQMAIAVCFGSSIGKAAFSSFASQVFELFVTLGFAGFFILGSLLIEEVAGTLELSAVFEHLFLKSQSNND